MAKHAGREYVSCQSAAMKWPLEEKQTQQHVGFVWSGTEVPDQEQGRESEWK